MDKAIEQSIIILILSIICLIYFFINRKQEKKIKFLENEVQHISVSFYHARMFIEMMNINNEWYKYIDTIEKIDITNENNNSTEETNTIPDTKIN